MPSLGCASGPLGSLLIDASSRPGRFTGPRIKFTSNGNGNRNGNRNCNRNRNAVSGASCKIVKIQLGNKG